MKIIKETEMNHFNGYRNHGENKKIPLEYLEPETLGWNWPLITFVLVYTGFLAYLGWLFWGLVK